MSLFLTGTDTGVGKTFVAVHLLRQLRAAGVSAVGMKPICCGDRDDAKKLLAASAGGISIDELNPIWLRAAVAPLVAAKLEDLTIDLEKVFQAFRELQARFEIVIVEGVGGWRVPITEDFFVSDLARRLNLPVIVVVQNRLGCLNQTLLTVESVRRHDCECAGVILNTASTVTDLVGRTNKEALLSLLEATPLFEFGESEILVPEWRKICRYCDRKVSI